MPFGIGLLPLGALAGRFRSLAPVALLLLSLVASPVAQWVAQWVEERAGELDIPVLKPAHPRDSDFQAALVAGKLRLPFHITGFWPAFWGAIIVGVVGWLLGILVRDRDKKEPWTDSSSA